MNISLYMKYFYESGLYLCNLRVLLIYVSFRKYLKRSDLTKSTYYVLFVWDQLDDLLYPWQHLCHEIFRYACLVCSYVLLKE
jgi:hypothetical protein